VQHRALWHKLAGQALTMINLARRAVALLFLSILGGMATLVLLTEYSVAREAAAMRTKYDMIRLGETLDCAEAIIAIPATPSVVSSETGRDLVTIEDSFLPQGLLVAPGWYYEGELDAFAITLTCELRDGVNYVTGKRLVRIEHVRPNWTSSISPWTRRSNSANPAGTPSTIKTWTPSSRP
jgi:hypothetical protein